MKTMLKTVLLRKSSKQQHLYEIENFCNIMSSLEPLVILILLNNSITENVLTPNLWMLVYTSSPNKVKLDDKLNVFLMFML